MTMPRSFRSALCAALLAGAVIPVRAGEPPAEVISFPAPRLTLWADRTQAVAFAIPEAATELFLPTADIADPAVAEVTRPAELLPGEKLGFLRVRGLHPGKTILRVGGASVPIEVRKLPESARAEAAARIPRMTAPVNGACVWGKFSVAVDWLDDAPGGTAGPLVALRLPDGRRLAPVVVTPATLGPVRHARFDLDAAEFPPGPIDLIPLASAVEGSAVRVVVLRPAADRIRAGECEDTAAAARPARFKTTKISTVVNDADASGGKAVACYSPDPVWTLPLEVAATGYYQLALVARGTLAGGALPSLAVYLNEEENPVATAHLAGVHWQRLIVGRPIRLEAGTASLSVRFENDFFAGKDSDRNVWLDRYELVRVYAGRVQQPALTAISAAGNGIALADAAPATAPPLAAMDPDERAAGELIAREEAALTELASGVQAAIITPGAGAKIEDAGIIRLEGWCRGPGGKDGLKTDLLVNGRNAGTARGERPVFGVNPGVLTAGANRLELETTGLEGKRTRSMPLVLWRAEKLRESAAAVAIAYPAPDQVIGVAEGVIARVAGARELPAWAELLFDGEPLGPRLVDPDPGAPLFFPLPLDALAPGAHALTVRVMPAGKDKVALESAPRAVVLRPADADTPPGRFARAIRLLDRFGFGAEPAEIARLLEVGEDRWLDERLSDSVEPAESSAWIAASSLFPPMRKDDAATIPRALTGLLLERNPVRLRFTLWAENHFSTWIQKTGARAKWLEHRMFSRLGVAPFGELLLASATSPAMLQYLDQQKSLAGRLNENYARELLELHTVGVHAGYTQDDVTHLASVLTGWMTAEESTPDPARGPAIERGFRFDPVLNEGSAQRVFGVAYRVATPAERFDRVRFALEVLAAHPATARFICHKLAAQYVAAEPADALIEALARVFLASGGDLRAVLREIPRRAEFWQAPPRMTTPLDFALRLARVSGSRQPGPLNDFLRRSGAGLFDRPSPDGYPESDAAYADTQALTQRWRFAQNFALPALDRGDDTALSPRHPAVLRAERDAALQLAASRLTGRPLAGASLTAAREMLVLRPGERRSEYVRRAAQIIAQLPEVEFR